MQEVKQKLKLVKEQREKGKTGGLGATSKGGIAIDKADIGYWKSYANKNIYLASYLHRIILYFDGLLYIILSLSFFF